MADVAIIPANVFPGTGAVYGGGRNVIGETLLGGEAVYKDTTDGNKLKKCDSNTATTPLTGKTYPPQCEFYGIALTGGAVGQPTTVQTGGEITIGGTLTPGKVYVLSSTPGAIRPADDLLAAQTPPHRLVIVGYAKTASILVIDPTIAGVAL